MTFERSAQLLMVFSLLSVFLFTVLRHSGGSFAVTLDISKACTEFSTKVCFPYLPLSLSILLFVIILQIFGINHKKTIFHLLNLSLVKFLKVLIIPYFFLLFIKYICHFFPFTFLCLGLHPKLLFSL